MAAARVLVVDDDPWILRMVSSSLEKRDFVVETARDGRQALERARTAPPSLIITDVMMPVMDGWAFVQELRQRSDLARIPVLFLTALGKDEDRLQALGLTEEDYISKPFRFDDLERRVAKALASAPKQNTLGGAGGAGGGYPQQGGYPGQGYPQQGGYPGQGYPQQGGYPGQGYPQQGGYPGQGYPQQGGYPGQGYPQQGGYPGQGYPQQGGYPGQGYPQQGGYPGQGYPQQGGYPGQGYPQQGGYPGPGFPQQGGYPPQQGGYPPGGQSPGGPSPGGPSPADSNVGAPTPSPGVGGPDPGASGSFAGPGGRKSTGLSGLLEQLGLSSLLVMMEMERKDGVLLLNHAEDKHVGRIFIRQGQVIQAKIDQERELEPKDSVYKMLTWHKGKFKFSAMEVDMEDTVKASTTSLLMEGARLIDEANR